MGRMYQASSGTMQTTRKSICSGVKPILVELLLKWPAVMW